MGASGMPNFFWDGMVGDGAMEKSHGLDMDILWRKTWRLYVITIFSR
jgi:hypothetical protein